MPKESSSELDDSQSELKGLLGQLIKDPKNFLSRHFLQLNIFSKRAKLGRSYYIFESPGSITPLGGEGFREGESKRLVISLESQNVDMADSHSRVSEHSFVANSFGMRLYGEVLSSEVLNQRRSLIRRPLCLTCRPPRLTCRPLHYRKALALPNPSSLLDVDSDADSDAGSLVITGGLSGCSVVLKFTKKGEIKCWHLQPDSNLHANDLHSLLNSYLGKNPKYIIYGPKDYRSEFPEATASFLGILKNGEWRFYAQISVKTSCGRRILKVEELLKKR